MFDSYLDSKTLRNGCQLCEPFSSFLLNDYMTVLQFWIKIKQMNQRQIFSSSKGSCVFTDISRCSTSCRHHAASALDFGQSKVTDHDLGVFVHAVVEQVLRLPGQNQNQRCFWNSVMMIIMQKLCTQKEHRHFHPNGMTWLYQRGFQLSQHCFPSAQPYSNEYSEQNFPFGKEMDFVSLWIKFKTFRYANAQKLFH